MKCIVKIFIVVCLLSLGLISSDSYAAIQRTFCQASGVQYDGWGRLRIVCDHQIYWTEPGGNCLPKQSLESLRQWQSIALSAVMSGLKLELYWEDPGNQCGRRLVTVGINR